VKKSAHFLHLTVEAFVERYTELSPDRSSLVLRNQSTGACCFLEGQNICAIQAVKPFQCQGFPNTWNFPGWQDVCEAIPISPEAESEKPI
jgi:uncharacterized protein